MRERRIRQGETLEEGGLLLFWGNIFLILEEGEWRRRADCVSIFFCCLQT
jgi:hypothetical protein